MNIYLKSTLTIPLLTVLACNNDVNITEKQPQFNVSPQNNDLGTVMVGEELTVPLRISSLYGDIQILGVEVQNILGNYCFYNGNLPDIEAGTNLEIEITYIPELAGLHQCKITVQGNASPEEHELMIFAKAVSSNLQIYPSSLDFGVVEVGETASLSLSISNDSPISTDITGVSIGDPQFSLLQPLPLTLDAEDTTILTMEYTPTTEDDAATTMTVQLDSSSSLPNISLMGNNCALGVPSAYDVDADGYTSCGGDCDDSNPTVSPSAIESCDLIDNDCDGIIDENTECYDDDGDGYSEFNGDCNDNDPAVHGEQNEIPGNGIDDNCDGIVDDESIDLDGDGYSEYGGDCDDSNPEINPAATEAADSLDNNCDGTIDENTENYDDDGDGYSEFSGDCNDNDSTISPDSTESVDGVDENCNGMVDDQTDVYDDDGDGYSEIGGDCNDSVYTISPAAAEIIGNNQDDNCDGTIE